jgi:hypothetical protein
VTSLGLSLLSPSLAWAKPLTKADIVGKKICWGGNDYKSFSSGGKVYSSIAGDVFSPGTSLTRVRRHG